MNYSRVGRRGSSASQIPAHSESPNDESWCETRRFRAQHHRHEISIAQPVGDVPADAQLDDFGIEATSAVDGITDYRPGHLGVS